MSAGSAQRIADRAEAIAAARRLAAAWRVAGPQRDRDREVPRAELAALAESGLSAISVPAAFGGPGLAPSVVAEVFATLAEADVALAQIAQNHFDFVDVLRFAAPTFRDARYAEVLAGARFGNALAERGAARGAIATRVTATPDGLRLSGVKHFATGALTADWIPVHAVDDAEALCVVYVERDAPGVDVREDWDAFGQRATFSGTAIFTDVAVAPEQVVRRGHDDPTLAVALLAGNQLIHAAIELGGARGALGALRRRGVAPPAEVARGVEVARLAVVRAGRLVDAAAAAPHPTAETAVRALAAVDAAKVIAYRVGPALGHAVLTVRPDVDAVLAAGGADRHWRNARVHSLHDPARLRERDLGAYVVVGTPPTMAAWLLGDRPEAP